MKPFFAAERRPTPTRHVPTGFTLVEALVCISLTAVAGSVLLAGIGSSLNTTTEVLHETIAMGMAEQLMDEVLGCRHRDAAAALNDALGPESGEAAKNVEGVDLRTGFDDIDDFDGFRSMPPTDRWGDVLGKGDGRDGDERPWVGQASSSLFDGWRQEVDVQRVGNQRVIDVRIVDTARDDRKLAELRQVVTNTD